MRQLDTSVTAGTGEAAGGAEAGLSFVAVGCAVGGRLVAVGLGRVAVGGDVGGLEVAVVIGAGVCVGATKVLLLAGEVFVGRATVEVCVAAGAGVSRFPPKKISPMSAANAMTPPPIKTQRDEAAFGCGAGRRRVSGGTAGAVSCGGGTSVCAASGIAACRARTISPAV
mgnify:CR=1 FL=1